MKYACIARHLGEFPVRLMCAVLGVSRSGFYAWRQRRPAAPRAAATVQLRLQIRALFREMHRRYGAPRIQRELRDAGLAVSRKRVARLMQEDGLVARARRRWKGARATSPTGPAQPNTLDRRFAVQAIGGVNRVWAADITALPTAEGPLYLAAVLDLGNRSFAGWALGPSMDGALPLRALQHALGRHRPGPGLLHHSDQGAQYTSIVYQAVLRTHGIHSSMSRRGNCWDNAVVESTFATLKTEVLPTAPRRGAWRTRAEAMRELEEYIRWFNTTRRHSSLDYLSPAAYAQQLTRGPQAA